MDEQMVGRMDGWMVGRTAAGTDGWVGESWMAGWLNG